GPLAAGSSFGGSVFRANLRTPPRFGVPVAAAGVAPGLAASPGFDAAVGAVCAGTAGCAVGLPASVGAGLAGSAAFGAGTGVDVGAGAPHAVRRTPAPLAAASPSNARRL